MGAIMINKINIAGLIIVGFVLGYLVTDMMGSKGAIMILFCSIIGYIAWSIYGN
jgi:cation transporter-like permease